MKTEIKDSKMLGVQYRAPGLEAEIVAELNKWQQAKNTSKLWKGDATLWTNQDESKWMGWLNLPNDKSQLAAIKSLAKELRANEITDVVVLGMGGSSLCPDMFSLTFGKVANSPRLHVLDSTDPLQIAELEANIDLKHSFFIVSSKSGSTLEPNIYKDYFYAQLQKVLGTQDVGKRFIAITDPGTKLEALAKKENFKGIFYGIESVGGRYSALSNFGMVPLGLMGIEVEDFLRNINLMVEACGPHVDAEDNPGVMLGVILGICAKHGKDKVTLIASPAIHSLGAWLEQLLAESTGKEGKGIIPVDQEPLGDPSVYDKDRVFAYIRLDAAPDHEQDYAVHALEQAGFVVIKLHVSDIMHLGAELFLWEIATAVAGSVIGINPFNQPDVEESKVLTLKLTSEYEKTHKLKETKAFFSEDGIKLYADEKIHKLLSQNLPGNKPTLENYLNSFLQLAKSGDYFDFSAFIARSKVNNDFLEVSRVILRDHTKLATCLGFGPRFLHSTGQAYKGGPNTGLFFQITCDYKKDIPVPEHQYTFGLVITAQAQADFTVLAQRDRRLLRIHLEDVPQGLKLLNKIFNKLTS